MMRSIAPFWDGNETWLVLGGGGLLVAFPLAYAVIMPAIYLPVIVMLLALVFRGVAFEFRLVSREQDGVEFRLHRGSTLAAFSQGVILGGLIQGIGRERRNSPAGISTGRRRSRCCAALALVAGYALLGATWLIMKTEGAVAERARGAGEDLLLLVLGFHGRGQPVDAAGDPAHRRALVLAAEFLFPVAGAADHRA